MQPLLQQALQNRTPLQAQRCRWLRFRPLEHSLTLVQSLPLPWQLTVLSWHWSRRSGRCLQVQDCFLELMLQPARSLRHQR